MKSAVLEKVLSRLDQIEPGEVQNLLSRLAREKGFFKKVFESLREGVLLLDEDGEISFINGAGCRLFGTSPELAQGRRLPAVVRGMDWEALMAGGRKSVSRDLEVFYPEQRFLNFYLSPISEEGEEDMGFVMLVRDVTRSREEAEEALESEKLNALTMLAAGVAHEIGNPLNSLSLHLQLMERKLRHLPKGDRDVLSGHLETAKGEISRLDAILKQFLQAIRPTVPERTTVDLHRLLHEALLILEPELESRGVRVALELAKRLPALELDEGQIKQAVYNLLRNAYQALASGDEGRIECRTRFTDYEVVLSIRDNGTGISPEVMGTLFEPFQTTKKSAGTGLGLLIVRRIVREHGGEIEVESEEGRGTTVSLFFPRGDKQVRLLEGQDAIEI
ncbi:MAG: two-component system sensor histidine kinase NtrB [Verrucomicrobiales bacterium]